MLLAIAFLSPLASSGTSAPNELALPRAGDHALRVLSPTVLELSIVTQHHAPDQPLAGIVGEKFTLHLPPADAFVVTANDTPVAVQSVGFKRRVLYAPLTKRDVRLGNWLYLELAEPLPPNANIAVTLREGGAQTVVGGAFMSAEALAKVEGPDVAPANENSTSGRKAPPTHDSAALWPADWQFTARTDPLRDSPAIHISQTGYAPSLPKTAMIGYYLGSLGELAIPAEVFSLRDARSHREVFRGPLAPRTDKGSSVTPPPYREVFAADFSGFTTPGEYRLAIDGLGVSAPFRIHDGAALAIARTYALGLYHQRCGCPNELPFTRHTHAACHVAPAEVPTTAEKFPFTWKLIGELAAEERADASKPPRPFTASETSQLYPFVKAGPLDVAGGHHDAGDYSKYTANSAALVHTLMFGVDALPGVAALDNLGLPESGDGIPDLLQEAKWEADFLAKLQDDDGGFYFLVYPRDRRYESNALPDTGEPQVVWPKNTAVTAAAVAALAQCASSPAMKKHFPADAARYLAQARRGWEFLQRAVESGAPSPPGDLVRGGADGAAPSTPPALGGLTTYQRLTHYGDNFAHNDELAWAACELFLATGEPEFQRALFRALPEPGRDTLRRWGWWRLSESWGNAIRSYAFAARSGRLPKEKLDQRYLKLCEGELLSAADDALTRSRASAYGTAFPLETKRYRNGGWYFSLDSAMDLAVGAQVLATNAGFSDVGACLQAMKNSAADIASDRPESPARVRRSLGEGGSRLLQNQSARAPSKAKQDMQNYVAALVGNLNYETGTNPVNITWITGLGRTRQREIVHQYSQNDRRALPPSGIPIGNIQAGQPYHAPSELPLRLLSFPDDGAASDPYAFYDRWSDVHNVSTEFVVTNQARGLVSAAFLAALTPAKDQPWRAADAKIVLSKENPEVGERVTARLEMVGGALGPDAPFASAGATSGRKAPPTPNSDDPKWGSEALADADIIWEAHDHEPQRGAEFFFTPQRGGAQWIEAEAVWPDGRRVFAVAEFQATSSQTAWIDDAWPDGAQPHAGGTAWIGAEPTPFSGSKVHTSATTLTGGAAGIHEHGFDHASEPLEIGADDVLFTHVWLDPQNPPREIMISWNDGSWEHRAYWGANVITYGADGSAGRKRIAVLPENGKWVRLDVPASAVGLGGRKVRGMSFASVDGRAVWDLCGVRARNAPDPPPKK
ncbi:MAG: glycoside hydrolase family 9 [Opitutus sp.]|nr:glycoside hydrolase family 9 [Opitutus sp.]